MKKEKNFKLYSIIITIIALILLIVIGIILFIPRNVISESEAKNKALDYGNFNEKDITYLDVEKDYDDNIYEIKFKDDNYIYEIDVHMKTGEIINFEKDAINQATISTPETTTSITEEEAKNIALNHTNQKSEDVTFTKVKLDIEDGRQVYEIEFYTTDSAYELYIDANTKEVIKYDVDYKNQQTDDSQYIGLAKAKEIALKHANLKESQVTWHKAKLDIEYNYSVYELEFNYQYQEYEYEINALNGNIIKYEIDHH